jgi:hypothetical protein
MQETTSDSTLPVMSTAVTDFDWPSYLEANNLEASPEAGFIHVETSQDSGVREGMIVERPHDLDKNSPIFWLASIDSVFGPLLKLSWLGDEDLQEIWHDLGKHRLYPLGWCQMNKVQLVPPKRVQKMCPLWATLALQYLEDVTFDTIEGEGVAPVDRIKVGMGIGVQVASDPLKLAQGKIVDNQSGLLRIEYLESKIQDLVFYTSSRLFQPSSSSELKNPPGDLIKNQWPENHAFVVEETLEVVKDGQVHLGRIDKLIEKNFFSIKYQEEQKDVIVSGNANCIAPLGTLQLATINLKADEKAAAKDKFPKLESATDLGFETGQKLMIIQCNVFHSSSILEILEHFLKLKIDSTGEEMFASIHDPILFPLSWCQANGVVFNIPTAFIQPSTKVHPEQDPVEQEIKKEPLKDENEGSWCPPIYFNYKCYSASFLSRARLAGLPKSVGPGPVQLVLRKVLNLIIGSSFKSGSVLRRLESKRDNVPANFVREELKGKSRVLNLKANIEIPTKVDQVEKYLREMCQKLSACPNLVSTSLYDDICPSNCHARPKADFKEDDNNGHNKPTSIPVPRKKGVRKRRHPDTLLVENARSMMNSSSDESEASSSRPSSPNGGARKQRRTKEWGNILPKSEIRTRGAKLPNFSLHLKIRPSRKDQRAMENSGFRNAFRYGDNYLTKSGAKKGRRELPPAFTIDDFPKPPPPIRMIRLCDNPEFWTPKDTARFLAQTSDCAHLARFILEEDIDGQSFMLLNYPTAKEYWRLKTTTAVSLCRHIESVRLAHVMQFS